MTDTRLKVLVIGNATVDIIVDAENVQGWGLSDGSMRLAHATPIW